MSRRRFTSRANEDGGTSTPRPKVERVTKLDAFVSRLREVGATDEEVNDLIEVWNERDDPHDSKWITSRDRLVRLSDTDLIRLLEASRREYYAHTHTPDEEAAEVRAAKVALARGELAITGDHKVAALIEWAGDDPIRAAVALEWERGRDPEHGPRVTLVSALEPIADPAPLPGDDDEVTPVSHAPVADQLDGIEL